MAKPHWLKIYPSSGTDFSTIKQALRSRGLSTVCEESHCPNMAECWHNEGTATFMLMGDLCTRGCKFCAVKTSSKGRALDPLEPQKLADAIAQMKLDYAVLTSVDRDDLEDGGSSHFAKCIMKIKEAHAPTIVEVLIPDFQGDIDALRNITSAKPEVVAHNVETVRRLQSKVRDTRAHYEQSLSVLRNVKLLDDSIYTKSAIIVGFGEKEEEVVETMKDLRSAGCDILTIGQYLKPRTKQLEVTEYVHPSVFEKYKRIGEELGFLYVAAGPFVRSSYRAGELFVKEIIEKKKMTPLVSV